MVHRRAERGGAECERIKLRTAALPSSALHRLCPLAVYGASAEEGGGLLLMLLVVCLLWRLAAAVVVRFEGKYSAVAGLVHAFDSWQRCV